MIGGVPKAPLAFLPDPAKLFTARAKRFAFLAESGGNLAPYLGFLAALTDMQARLAGELPPVASLPADRVAQARANRMPPIDRSALATDPAMLDVLTRVTDAVEDLVMPEPARLALGAVRAATAEDRAWLIGNVLSGEIPTDSAAPHLFAAAAVQLHLARIAATLDAAELVFIAPGVCPSCGARPVSSSVIGVGELDGVRYASCSCCATRWNVVRLTCLCCASTKGISYRSVETEDATVKAEICSECDSWVKILYQNRNHSLDPVADDVGSLGLDLLMRETDFRRGGVNPYLVGY